MQNKIFDKEKNQEERMKFVTYWAEYVRTHTDKDWGEQQALLINAQVSNKSHLTREQYLEIMKAGKKPIV